MELIKLKLLDTDGMTLLTAPAAGQVSLVYMNAYKPGDRVSLEIGTPGQYVVIQFEDTMAPALVYVVKREINFHIPFGEQAITYSPKSFAGACHIIRARFATPEEIAARRNLAYNPYDEHGDTGFFPHAHANVETRGEAVFAARNAIDGIYENDAHGIWPYQSWGINRDPNAALTLDFGRPVTIDELRLTLRADFPHDAWWLVRVAANKCKDHLKSAWVRKVDVPGDDALPEPRGAPGSDADDPAQSVADRAGAAELETLVRGLREPYGKIAVLYFLEHRETAEIAKLVGRPPATVNSQLWRAKLLLRQQITERRQKE